MKLTYKRIVKDYEKGLFDDLEYPFGFMLWAAGSMDTVNDFQQICYAMRNDEHRDRYSAIAVIQKMRWDDSKLAINNNTAPYLARIVMKHNKVLRGMFRLRGKTW